MGFSEEELQRLYATMSHPARRRILHFLSKNRKATFTDLMNELDLSETGKVSYHLTQMQPLIAQDEKKRYYLSDLGKLAINIERKVIEELGVQHPRSDASSYWLVIVLCGIFGWLISQIPLKGFETMVGVIISGILLGAILAYRFRIAEYQSAKAGSILGIIIGILTFILDGPNLVPIWAFNPILLYPLYMIATILPLSIVCMMVSTVSTSFLHTFFKIRPKGEKKDDPLFRLTIRNPLSIIILGSLSIQIFALSEALSRTSRPPNRDMDFEARV